MALDLIGLVRLGWAFKFEDQHIGFYKVSIQHCAGLSYYNSSILRQKSFWNTQFHDEWLNAI